MLYPRPPIILAVSLLIAAVALPANAPAAPISSLPFREGAGVGINCLIVGGGPDKENNEVGIESNVRYVRSILPPGSTSHALYANGMASSPIVQYEDDNGDTKYRPTVLKNIDGPSTRHAFDKLLGYYAHGTRPVLLYFTGHGSPDDRGEYRENMYDLWGDDSLDVTDLTEQIATVDSSIPVTLVMVQCFSGAFAPVFYPATDVDDAHPRVRPNSCGFFAGVPEREAAGCTPEVDEANYHDFTTYFFGALSGHDRVGRPVTTADYDHDGIVEMDEAYAYSLATDPSIDTPMATTDDYVRRFTHDTSADIFATPYSTVLTYATPAQKFALEALSKQLKLSGEDRLAQAHKVFVKRTSVDEDSVSDEEDETTARWIRFVRLSKTVVLEHRIETSGPADVRDGLNALLAAEHRNPIR